LLTNRFPVNLKQREGVLSLAKSVSFAIDVAGVVSKVAKQHSLNLPPKIVMFHYDEEADTLYVHFEYPSKSIDSNIVDKHGEIILGLNQKGKTVNMTIINALTHKQK
jgi:uncharacterized protein YuzE